MQDQCVIGVDFGADSARAIIVDCKNGEMLGEAQASYPRWLEGMYCEPEKNQFRQHPRDYLEALEFCVKDAMKHAGARHSSRGSGRYAGWFFVGIHPSPRVCRSLQ